MSRIGKLPVNVPEGVEVKLEGDLVRVKGPRGALEQRVSKGVQVVVEDGWIRVQRDSDHREHRALHGLTRTLVANMITGVTQGFRKSLEIVGVGYRAEMQGKILNLALGYSHPIKYPVPEGIEISVERNTIHVEGIDKQRVGQISSEIRAFRKPEPYKGKGIRYVGEHVRRKVGKGSAAGR